MPGRIWRAFKKHPGRYPGVIIIVLATLLGAAGALSQKFALNEGLNAGFAVLCFTALFILLPFWILALLVSYIYRRSGVDYSLGRLWLWVIPAAIALVMAIYFGVVGEQAQLETAGSQARSAAASSTDVSGVVIFFFYLYLSVIGMVVAFVSSMFRLWLLKLKQNGDEK